MTSTGARLLAWLRRHVALVVATVVTVAFVATMATVLLRIAEERRAQTVALCEGFNENRSALRGLIVSITAPSLADPNTPPDRRELAQRFRDEELAKLPLRDC